MYTQAQLSEKSMGELVELYNSKSPQPVKKFSDKPTAIKRILALVVTEAQQPKPKKERKVRQKRFVFQPEKQVKLPKPTSFRSLVVEALRKGSSFEEMSTMYENWYKEKNKYDPKKQERRTYEGIRLVHYVNGFGLREEDGKIFLVEPK